jgi:hypothetical protein
VRLSGRSRRDGPASLPSELVAPRSLRRRLMSPSLTRPDLEASSRRTLARLRRARADDFWQATYDHDVSKNVVAPGEREVARLLAAVRRRIIRLVGAWRQSRCADRGLAAASAVRSTTASRSPPPTNVSMVLSECRRPHRWVRAPSYSLGTSAQGRSRRVHRERGALPAEPGGRGVCRAGRERRSLPARRTGRCALPG